MKYYSELTNEQQAKAIKRIQLSNKLTTIGLPLFDSINANSAKSLHDMLTSDSFAKSYIFDENLNCYPAPGRE